MPSVFLRIKRSVPGRFQLKTSESQFSVTPAEEIQDLTPQSPLLSYGGASSGSVPNHTSKSANGSIITMTLKNNHLIVETEEREVAVDKGAVRTTTKFTATSSPHENNVFVVEVQRGVEPASSCYAPALYSREDLGDDEEARAQVHRPAELEPDSSGSEADVNVLSHVDEDDEEEEEEEEECAKEAANTGLSQSDLSVSSAGSNNPSYRYGNQVAYEAGRFGYPEEVPASPTPSELEEERLQEEQRVLGNCRVVVPALVVEPELHDESSDEVPSLQRSGSLPGKALPSSARKRGSLPIITTELMRHGVDRGSSSPKFHKLSNESSPPEEACPLGVIPETTRPAQQYENQAFVHPDHASS